MRHIAAAAARPKPRSTTLVEEYFERQLELSPMAATAIGDSRYDDRLDETTSPGFRETPARHRTSAFLERARRIDAAALSPDGAHHLRHLRQRARARARGPANIPKS